MRIGRFLAASAASMLFSIAASGQQPQEAVLNPPPSPTATLEQAPAEAVATPIPAPVALPPKVKLREGTEVRLVFADPLSSATSGEGDRFNLRVEDSVKVDGMVVIPSGAIAVGTVTSARKRGFMGKAGELNIMLDYVKSGDERVRIRASKGKAGEGRVGATVALTVLFGPLGLLKRGKDVEIKQGTPITAFVDQDVELVVLQ